MTPLDAATWMLATVKSQGELYQEAVANELIGHGDEALAYYDDSGNVCVGKKVLSEFKKISPDIVWSKSGKYWRQRESDDEPGRMQA